MSTASEKLTHRGLFRRTLFVVVGMPVVLLASLVATPRHDSGWIDPVTGSMKSQTRWFGLITSTTIDKSAIENWILRREGRYENNWAFLNDTEKTIWGRSVEFACGNAPPIYELHTGEPNDAFTRLATDLEISEFVRVMRVGTEAEKRQAVEAAFDRTIKRL